MIFCYSSIGSPHFLQTLTFFFFVLLSLIFLSICLCPTLLVTLPHLGQTGARLEISIGAGNSILWPASPCLLGRRCFIRILMPSILALLSLGKTCKTLPVLPLSFPHVICTLSPFFIFHIYFTLIYLITFVVYSIISSFTILDLPLIYESLRIYEWIIINKFVDSYGFVNS